MPRRHKGSRKLSLSGTCTLEASAGDSAVRRLVIEAYDGGVINGSNILDTVVVDLEGMALREDSLPILREHDSARILGHSTNILTNDKTVRVEAMLSGPSEEAIPFSEAADNGFPWRSSIGAEIQRVERIKAGSSCHVNGQNFEGPLLVIRKSMLKEVSIVSSGANRGTTVSLAASLNHERIDMDYDEWLQAKCIELKLDKDNLTDFEQITLKAQYESEKPPIPEQKRDVDPEIALRKERAEYFRHEASLRAACGDHSEILAKAIEGNWDVDRCKTEIELKELRAQRKTAPNFHIGGTADSGVAIPKVMEAALARTVGVKDIETHYNERALECADKQFRSGIGLQQILLECACMNGYSGDRWFAGDADQLHRVLEAAFSTNDIDGILGNTANKQVAQAFKNVESTWRKITKVSPVKNFQQVTGYRLTTNLEYEKIGNGGKISQGTMGEASYTNQANTYAKLIRISRTDIINDDLGVLTSVPQALGRGSALKMNSVFWTEFMNNGSFFTASTPINYISGATTALDATGIKLANNAFKALVDESGHPMATEAKILLVPSALETGALSLIGSMELRESGGAATNGTANPWRDKFNVVSSAYLSNGNYTGYSALAWYLLADPMDIAVMECVFLNGKEMPTISRSSADFDSLGIQMRGFHDFGCSKQEARGGVKSKGEA